VRYHRSVAQMNVGEELRRVATLDDLKRVLIAARCEGPRHLNAIEFDREQYEAQKRVREEHGMDAQAIVQQFATRYTDIMVHAEAANLASNPEFVAAVARLSGHRTPGDRA